MRRAFAHPAALSCPPRGAAWLLATLGDASLAAVDLPRMVWALDHVQRDRARCHQRAVAVPADLTPSLIRYPRNAAVAREPPGSGNGSRLPAAVRYKRKRES